MQGKIENIKLDIKKKRKGIFLKECTNKQILKKYTESNRQINRQSKECRIFTTFVTRDYIKLKLSKHLSLPLIAFLRCKLHFAQTKTKNRIRITSERIR